MPTRKIAPLTLRYLRLLLVSGLLGGAAAIAVGQARSDVVPLPSSDRAMSSSDTLRAESAMLIRLLDNLHYNHDAVKPSDYDKAIPDYMTALDYQRLFFLKSDKTSFMDQYGKSLYYNVKQTGDVDPAYKMFAVYEERVKSRTSWIFAELAKDIDLTVEDDYAYDRSKAEWPENEAAADTLWRKRLKYEILGEILGKPAFALPLVDTPAPSFVINKDAKEALSVQDLSEATFLQAAKELAPGATPTPDSSIKDRINSAPSTKTIADAKETIRKRYERLLSYVGKYKSDELAELYLTSIAELYDPHSSYFSPESFDDFSINIRLNLFGIGAVLGIDKDETCVINEIVAGGPAYLSGALHPDDKIVAVAQGSGAPVDVIGMKLREIVQLIRGPKDTKVTLTIVPGGASDNAVRKEVVITRDLVKLDNARAHAGVFDVPASDGKAKLSLGVISLPSFYGGDDGNGGRTSAAADVAELVKRLQAADVKGIVLDLRHNGGGILGEAIDLAGLFISRGAIVQVKQTNKNPQVDTDDDPGIAYSGPLAVLVDRYSASASEIVAGALQNYGRAIIIGDSSTHGKGTVQQIFEMSELLAPQQTRTTPNMLTKNPPAPEKYGAAKITIQKFYLPNGSSTQLRGVVPDIVLPSVDEYVPEIGESDLPHALVWDEIPPAPGFTGHPLEPTIITSLLESSRARQASLEEFKYVGANIDRFKEQQAKTVASLNLATRLQQKDSDSAFVKLMKAERDRLAKNDFPYKEVRLSPAPPPRIRSKASEDDDLSTDDDPDVPYTKADVNLRESFRILSDAVALASKPSYVINGRAPLTVPATGRN